MDNRNLQLDNFQVERWEREVGIYEKENEQKYRSTDD